MPERTKPSLLSRGVKRLLGAVLPTENVPCALVPHDEAVFWAFRNVPVKDALNHFLVCGNVGSGKTTIIQLLLQSIAHRFMPGRGTPEHLIIYDAKGEALPRLAALGLTPDMPNFWILNPTDARAAVWKIGEASSDPSLALGLATLLVPPEPKSTAPFFSNAARDLTYAAILGLQALRSEKWTLRDLLCACETMDRIRAVTRHDQTAAIIADSILNDSNHAGGVHSTLTTKLRIMSPVAALQHTAPAGKHFTVAEFLKKPGVLVLGDDPLLKESLWPLNAILLQTISKHVLRGPERSSPRYWFVLDEFRAMEKAGFVGDLLNRGRSKGASVVLGVQNVVGLVDVYQQAKADDLLSLCSTKTFLHLGDPVTAEWAAKYFGEVRAYETSFSRSRTERSTTFQESTTLTDRTMFVPSFFSSLPLPGNTNIFPAVTYYPFLGQTVVSQFEAAEVFSWCAQPSEGFEVASAFSRDPQDQWLRLWDEREVRFFCGEAVPATEDRKATNSPVVSDPEPEETEPVLPTRKRPPDETPGDSLPSRRR